MNFRTNIFKKRSIYALFVELFVLQVTLVAQIDSTRVFQVKKITHDNYQQLNEKLPMDAPLPDNIKSAIEYDLKTGNYVLRTKVGEIEISTPFSMNSAEYLNYSAKKELQTYWKELINKDSTSIDDKFSITDLKFNIGKADKAFGPGGVQIRTQGSAELIFGVKTNKIDNPALTERMRTTVTPDFDEKIQMNVTGSVGDKINVGLNYNTESTFDFDQKMLKLAYKGKEDDIIQNLQAGNVSMQLNSSLISGSTALFGIKTDLKFGKLNISAIASQQESETKTVSSKGGAQTTKFEINIDNYDENRHYFLSHYFRNNFENSMSRLPFISSGITVNRIEVWVTNKRANYDQARNIIAFMDLAETDSIDNNHWSAKSAFSIPYNDANNLYSEIKDLPNIRDIQQTNSVLATNYSAFGIYGGEDYEKIESARKLDPSEYTFNQSLGILSLRNSLNPDEVLGVAFEYTQAGKVYQVGEFSTDAIEPPNALIVKLLKSTVQSPQLKIWDLMMKNVYATGAMQIQKSDFELQILYRNDSIGTNLRYLTEGKIQNQLLLRVMSLDNLDPKQESNPDGKFDYVEGYTAISSSGRIMFPVLEPFGSHLRKMIGDNTIADKYIFQELYDSTLIIAQEFSEKNKFVMEGEYKGSNGSEIRLNAMNVPRGSVTVTAGGATLVENLDYTVDYMMGIVTVLNQSIIESGTKVDVKLENQSMFSLQRKTMLGTHIEYAFSKDFSLGGTLLHLSEMPLTTKVNTGSEPISNTIWGFNTAWKTQTQWLTNVLDKLPFVNATAPSTIALNAEFAQLRPGHHSVVGDAGYAYLDDFESTKTTIDIHYPTFWYLASTPFNNNSTSLFPEAALNNNIEYGKNRALLAWYYVDPLLNQSSSQTPANLRNNTESKSNHYTRSIMIPEIFPNREMPATLSTRMTVMNLSYYPTIRGPYNLDASTMDNQGNLLNPENRWGGIMRKLDITDFEMSNIEYIEFWLMDPFIYNDGNDLGGDLYLNLGDISEDILKDGKKFFEHGLPIDDDPAKKEQTVWGEIPRIQSTVTAFDNSAGARDKQDVGLNGLNDETEKSYPAYKEFVDNLTAKLDPAVFTNMQIDPLSPINDPAGDNYQFYRGSYYDEQEADILTRYKRYNGTEGNSPDAAQSSTTYTTTATSLPDLEDINVDNTLNEYEKYYQYHVEIKPNKMVVGLNYITDKITTNVSLENGNVEPVTWYQFKIPIREYNEKVGSIRNFKSIRFVRMFMTNFKQEKHLRFATLDLVRGEWRGYTKTLFPVGENPTSEAKLEVQAVNIEENADKIPVNYVLPPGITRETDPGQPQLLQQNEQSMVLRVRDLAPKDAKAVYKNTSFDMRQYKRIQLFVHAEQLIDDETNLKNDEISCFIRIGTDMVNNYYEYEVPMKLTPHGVYSGSSSTDREAVWNPENFFDFTFKKLTDSKLKRNQAMSGSSSVNLLTPYTVLDEDKPNNRITIVGNPTISEVQNIMIGIRNISGEMKSAEIWVNELRMSEFNEESAYAALANLSVGLSDLGNVNFSGRIEQAGYGGLESNVMERRLDDLYQVNFSTNLDMGRFLPDFLKLQLPAFYSYSNETISPKYNPLDQDVLFDDALSSLNNDSEKDSLLSVSQIVQQSRSFSVSSAKLNIKSKEPKFYDPANISASYSFSESTQQSAEIEQNMNKNEKASLSYNYSFNNKSWEPFKDVKFLDTKFTKLIKDFNFNPFPSSIAFRTQLNRQYSQIKLRDFGLSGGISDNLSFSKDFMWNRDFDIKFNPTKAISLSLQTASNANIEEPYYTPEIGKEYYEQWRDTVWNNIRKLGTPYTYQQVFSASWAIPIEKLPFMDWTKLNTSYNSTYSWNKSARLKDMEDMGNIASTMNAWQVDGQLNFEALYNSSKYLKEINQKYNGSRKVTRKKEFKSKKFTKKVNIIADSTLEISHKLASRKFDFSANDKFGKALKLNYKILTDNSISIISKDTLDSISVILTTIDPDLLPPGKEAVDFVTRLLMTVRRASFTYRESNSFVLPGFFPEGKYFGQQDFGNGLMAPGIPFSFGYFDENTLPTAIANGWMNMSDSVVSPATTAATSDFDFKASLEPIGGLKIDINAKRYEASNTSIHYMFDGMPQNFTGSYNITQIAIKTAFRQTANAESNYYSQTFNDFLENRHYFADKLNAKYLVSRYPSSGFLLGNELAGATFNPELGKVELNSPEVLIPAFLSAYTGKNPAKTETNPFPSLLSILPNWRVSYDGLSKLSLFKDKIKSFSITHGYTCRYSIGNYTSFSTWVPVGEDDNALGFIRDVQSDNPIPSMPFDISAITLNEQFSPLIGINAALKNSMTMKLEYRKQRNLSLNLSSTQVIDASSDEFVLGMGYVVNDFDVILKLKGNQQSRVKNNLKVNADISYKDIKSLLRKIEENLTQASSGNKLFTIKIMADYVFSSKVNIQLFYDRQVSTPLISSSFPVASSNMGVNFKFMLTR